MSERTSRSDTTGHLHMVLLRSAAPPWPVVARAHVMPRTDGRRRLRRMLSAIWRLLLVAILLGGCSLVLPVIRGPIDIDCHDVSDEECNEAWAAAQHRFPPDREIEGGTVSVAGGAAECVPGPCANLFAVMLNLRDARLRMIVVERQGDGDLVVIEVQDLIE